MKFKNKDDKFEWDLLNLTEEDYIRKLKLLNPFSNVNNIFEYDEAREKWNNSTNGKKFKDKIKRSLKILKKDEFNYSDIIFIYKTLSSILTHIFIELEYYESNRKQLKEFLNITNYFLNNYNKLLNEFKNLIFNPNLLNNYKIILIEILNYFNDY